MFNDSSIIKEVNILNKFICYLFVLTMCIIIKDIKLLIVIDSFFLLVTREYKSIFIYNIVITLFLILNIFYSPLLWINKIMLLVLYTIILKKVTKLNELRYIIEITLYKFRNKKITYKLFYFIYFIKNFKVHFKKMLVLKDDYLIKVTPKFLIFMIKVSYKEAKRKRKEFIEINSTRFYNYSSKRTYIEKLTWESWDSTYLITHIIILVIAFIYGR